MTSSLPPPAPSQAYVDVSVLEAGHIGIPEHIIVDGGSHDKFLILPVLSFLLRHSESKKNIVFDLGLRKDWEEYPPAVNRLVKEVFDGPIGIPDDVIDSLRKGGLHPADIPTIIISHIHFDHVGDPSLFPSSQFVVGSGAQDLLANGYTPSDAATIDSHFSRTLLPQSRTSFLAYDDWTPLGPFPRAHDFFGDGSVYLIDAAGHMPGHINALVRTSPDGAWAYLAGDSAHDPRIVRGEKEIGVYHNPVTRALGCMHGDLEGARTHVERVRRVGQEPRVQVLLAHDFEWFGENKGKGVIFPGKISPL